MGICEWKCIYVFDRICRKNDNKIYEINFEITCGILTQK